MTFSRWILGLSLSLLAFAPPAALWPRCRSCHMIGPGAQTRAGPHLTALAGRKAGSLPGFRYSSALQRAGADGLVWTPETLSLYLSTPEVLAPGLTKRAGRIADPAARRDLIAWLLRQGAPD